MTRLSKQMIQWRRGKQQRVAIQPTQMYNEPSLPTGGNYGSQIQGQEKEAETAAGSPEEIREEE